MFSPRKIWIQTLALALLLACGGSDDGAEATDMDDGGGGQNAVASNTTSPGGGGGTAGGTTSDGMTGSSSNETTPTANAEPWPAPADFPVGVVSLVLDDRVLSAGEAIQLRAAPAGLENTTLEFELVLSNKTEQMLSFGAEPWLEGEGIDWASSPPETLASGMSVRLGLQFDSSALASAAVVTSRHPYPSGQSLSFSQAPPQN